MNKIYKNKKKLLITILFSFVTIIFVGSFFTKKVGETLHSVAAIYSEILVMLTNKERKIQNIADLKTNVLLEKAAQMKADDMAKFGYFAHNSPDGKTPWYWFKEVGYSYIYAGENLAVNFDDSEEVERAWMNSETHRLNILNKKFKEIGIATSTGLYKGRQAVFVVQLFGTQSDF